jgi:23S rRNA-/tRNA-specific pseudouridylate synthase
MDGPYAATVHKLLLYLFPPPSLFPPVRPRGDESSSSAEGQNDENDVTDGDDINNEKGKERHDRLIRSIMPLHVRTCLRDDPHRMVHQLDYATSGVLLVGKNRNATSVACRAFEGRRASKSYVAVVVASSSSLPGKGGTTTTVAPLDKRDFINKLPILPSSSLDAWSDGTLELRYKKKRQRDANCRCMPISSVFDRFRGELIRRRRREKRRLMMEEREERKEKEDKEEAGENDNTREVTMNNDGMKTTARVDDPGRTNWDKEEYRDRGRKSSALPNLPCPKVNLTSGDVDELLSLGSSWKAVRARLAASSDGGGAGCDGSGVDWIDVVETMSEEYNASLRTQYDRREDGYNDDDEDRRGDQEDDIVVGEGGGDDRLPPLFRIENDDDLHETFYVCASIGEIGGRFRVVVDPASVSPLIRDLDVIVPDEGLPPPQMRPALTKCTVIWRGWYDSFTDTRGMPVAKVLLRPLTGRRHQLRVHLALVAGCPILGDATYGGNYYSDVNYDNAHHDEGIKNSRCYACRRMCLHAKELTIPLIGNEIKTFAAPDPFVVTTKEGDCAETLVIL